MTIVLYDQISIKDYVLGSHLYIIHSFIAYLGHIYCITLKKSVCGLAWILCNCSPHLEVPIMDSVLSNDFRMTTYREESKIKWREKGKRTEAKEGKGRILGWVNGSPPKTTLVIAFLTFIYWIYLLLLFLLLFLF